MLAMLTVDPEVKTTLDTLGHTSVEEVLALEQENTS